MIVLSHILAYILGFVLACILFVHFETRAEEIETEREADVFAEKLLLNRAALDEVRKPDPNWDLIRSLNIEEDSL